MATSSFLIYTIIRRDEIINIDHKTPIYYSYFYFARFVLDIVDYS